MDKITIGLNDILPQLGYKEAKEHQFSVIEAYCNRKDVFLCAPCGSGKSLCYEVAPYIMQYVQNDKKRAMKTSNIVIIVQPLIGLMKEQVEKLCAKNLEACYIGQSGIEKRLSSGDYNLVFSSPESLLTKHTRKLLMSTVYQDNIKALFIDESHCIKKWGMTAPSEVGPFRQEYGRLGELRAMMPPDTPCISLTATANNATKKLITENLCLHEAVEICIAPNKEHIRYAKVKNTSAIKSTVELFNIFKPLIEEISCKGVHSDRYLVFCQTTEQATNLFNLFSSKLGTRQYHEFEQGGVNDDRNRYFAQFHKTTDPEIKDTVIQSFGDPNGLVRVLFATIAFGMGMDVKGLYTIIHLGPSKGLDDYVQESGRAGRDSSVQCHALMIQFPRCIRNCTTEMKDYVKNTDICRRQGINQYFDTADTPKVLPPHNCCDICAETCNCQCNCIDLCSCESKCLPKTEYCTLMELSIIENEAKHKITSKHCFPDKEPSHTVSRAKATKIRLALLELRKRLVAKVPEKLLFTSLDIASGYHMKLIDHIVRDIAYIDSLDMLKNHFDFYEDSHAVQTFDIVQGILQTNSSDDSDDDMSSDVNVHDTTFSSSLDTETSSESDVVVSRRRHAVHLQSSTTEGESTDNVPYESD